jgi:alkylation response protein AidB-like acyl-CoA dehydrogenase
MAPGAGIQVPDIDLSGDDASFADELSQFLDEHLDGFKARFKGAREADAQMAVAREWQAAMASGGWAAITWPEEYGGRAATSRQQLAFHLTCAQRRVPQ